MKKLGTTPAGEFTTQIEVNKMGDNKNPHIPGEYMIRQLSDNFYDCIYLNKHQLQELFNIIKKEVDL